MRNNDKDSMNVSSHRYHPAPLPFGIRRSDLKMINDAYDRWLELCFPDEARARGQHKFLYGKKEIN